MPKPGFYAVRVGRKPGVYTSWDETKKQVDNFTGCVHKKFATREQAEAFIRPLAGASHKAPPTGSASKGKGRPRTEEGASQLPAAKKARTSAAGDKVFSKDVRKVYCDGSSRGNGQKGAVAGIGVFWGHEVGAPNLSERLPGTPQTNNRAEMYALARILEEDPTPELPLTICTDSQYTISVFSTWIPGWIRRNWRNSQGEPVANKDLILYVLSLIKLRSPKSTSGTANIIFQKVKAHVGIDGNEMADQLANNGAMQPEKDAIDFAAKTAANEKLLADRGRADAEPLFEVQEEDLWTEEELKAMAETQEF